MSEKHPPVEYCPPSHDVLVHFARSVGEGLGGEYAAPEVISGLADFMQVIAQVLAHDLNRKQSSEFDSRVE